MPVMFRRRIDKAIPGDASFYLDFERGIACVLGRVVDPLSLFTVTRSTPGWARGDGGLLAQFPANTPRLSRGRDGGGLVIERSATNRCLSGSDMTGAGWTVSAMTVSPNGAVAVDGTLTASVVTDTAASGATSGTLVQAVAIPVGSSTVSFYLKQTVGSRMKVYVGIPNVTGGFIVIDTANGVLISVPPSLSARIDRGPLGYLRVVATLTKASDPGFLIIDFTRESDAAQPIAFNLDRVQVEDGTSVTSAMGPSANPASRDGDVVDISVSSNWFRGSEGTIVLDTTLKGGQLDTQVLAFLSMPGAFLTIQRGNNAGQGGVQVAAYYGSTLQASGATLGLNALPRRMRVAITYGKGSFRLATVGGQLDYLVAPMAYSQPLECVQGSSPVPGPFTKFSLGHANGNSMLDGVAHRIAYFPMALDNTEISNLIGP